MIHVNYDLEPIGVGGALEAVNVHPYCSKACQRASRTDSQISAMNPDLMPGLHCERCNAIITEGKELL
jgi:hypothetical protein